MKRLISTSLTFLTLLTTINQSAHAAIQVPSGGGNVKCIDTAIGCIPISSTENLMAFFLRWLIALSGGIAILLIAYASFIIITSTGDPKRIQAGKELLTAALAGIIFIVFSVFLLRLVGADILGIPEFIKNP